MRAARPAEPKVAPSDYCSYGDFAVEGRLDLWENHGWTIWSRTEAEDLLMWLSPYRIVGGRQGGPFAVADTSLSQTVLLRSGRGGDPGHSECSGQFFAVGYDQGDYMPGTALEVRVDADEAVWRIGGRQFIAQPPTWRIQGEHAGVSVDLTMTAMGSPMWLTDSSRAVEDSMERWFLQCARAGGWIEFRGQRLQIEGYASHERHVHCGNRYDPPRLLDGRGITWHNGSGQGVQLIALSRPSKGVGWARLIFDEGNYVAFNGRDDLREIEETDYCVDPESRLHVPIAWRCRFRSGGNTLEVTARARARAYYLWNTFKFGCTVLYWWLADAVVEYSLADGRRGGGPIQYTVHDNRLLYRQHRDG